MVTTDDGALAARLRRLRNHGGQRVKARVLEFIEPGYNYRLSELPAALGLSQMRRLDAILADRRATAMRYNQALEGIPGVWVPEVPTDAIWSYQSYVVVLNDRFDRDRVIAGMDAKGIETTVGTYACHQHPAFLNWISQPMALPNSARFADHSLTLPLVPRMSRSEVETVVESLSSLLGSL